MRTVAALLKQLEFFRPGSTRGLPKLEDKHVKLLLPAYYQLRGEYKHKHYKAHQRRAMWRKVLRGAKLR